MVCSIDHLASAAGVTALDRGGSAADAAIAANAVLAVTSPHMCGLGGDLFALVHDGSAPAGGAPGGTVRALNASGRAGSGADAGRLRGEGHRLMPHRLDVRSVPVPGCVDGWLALHARYGRLPLAELFAPAIRLARDGFPASPLLAPRVRDVADRPGAADLAGVRTAGDRVRRPGVARALEAVAAGGRAGFYLGEFGEGLLELGAGEYTRADLERAHADWVEPLRVRAFGHDVWSAPPNSQGYLLLLSLGILDGLDLPHSTTSAAWAHVLAGAARAAAHDRVAVLHEHATGLLSPAEIERRRAAAGRRDLPVPAADGDTTYLCAVDGDGLGVSLIQSNASGFGSFLFEPRTGINLHNRGIGFSLEPGHPAEYGPGRRPPHTLTPALVTRPDGSLRAVAGTMGGDAQPQILLQVLTRLLRHGQDPGAVIAAPRWRFGSDTGFDTWQRAKSAEGTVVELEDGTGWQDGLSALGHRVSPVPGGAFGHAHLIEVLPDGMLAGAADPRSLTGAAIGR
ncbi:gamma-glutamyltransferase [Nonomuraea sp. MCN248]|uniref:Gamma-glutamyltransferase n=1 Tax=Nonomuraea corallina TaxID=2989783 RepID=A0ABT4SI42_9ACTN|nr:gamma-glutamyltransferase [Nonomuraea corallina]MDA0636886.1 gamma-glutamyltransferase [Nonomuraea corallina]